MNLHTNGDISPLARSFHFTWITALSTVGQQNADSIYRENKLLITFNVDHYVSQSFGTWFQLFEAFVYTYARAQTNWVTTHVMMIVRESVLCNSKSHHSYAPYTNAMKPGKRRKCKTRGQSSKNCFDFFLGFWRYTWCLACRLKLGIWNSKRNILK